MCLCLRGQTETEVDKVYDKVHDKVLGGRGYVEADFFEVFKRYLPESVVEAAEQPRVREQESRNNSIRFQRKDAKTQRRKAEGMLV